MSDDEAAFLRTIRENPDADLPRLVYADWLQEQGETLRAEFLRAHLELERLTEDSPRRRELAFWCRTQLDTQPHLLFEPPLQPKFGRYGRGLIEAAEFWNASDGEIASAFHLAPLQRVWVYGLGQWYSSLLAVPANNCLHTLDLTGNRLAADELRFANLPCFPHLKELVLTGCDLDDEAARVLCEHPAFQKLERIHVGGNPFSEEGRQRLREHFGERLELFGARDPKRLYAFHKDSGLVVGFGKDLTQLFAMHSKYETVLVWFDHLGRHLSTEAHEHGNWTASDELWKQRSSEVGFEFATVRVNRFNLGDWWIADYPYHTNGELHDLSVEAGWENWLKNGHHTFGNVDTHEEWWLKRDGTLVGP